MNITATQAIACARIAEKHLETVLAWASNSMDDAKHDEALKAFDRAVNWLLTARFFLNEAVAATDYNEDCLVDSIYVKIKNGEL